MLEWCGCAQGSCGSGQSLQDTFGVELWAGLRDKRWMPSMSHSLMGRLDRRSRNKEVLADCGGSCLTTEAGGF